MLHKGQLLAVVMRVKQNQIRVLEWQKQSALILVTTIDMTFECFATLHGCSWYTELDQQFYGSFAQVCRELNDRRPCMVQGPIQPCM